MIHINLVQLTAPALRIHEVYSLTVHTLQRLQSLLEMKVFMSLQSLPRHEHHATLLAAKAIHLAQTLQHELIVSGYLLAVQDLPRLWLHHLTTTF